MLLIAGGSLGPHQPLLNYSWLAARDRGAETRSMEWPEDRPPSPGASWVVEWVAGELAAFAVPRPGLPTITVGSVGLTAGDAGLAELAARHARGEFDLVALGRALLANPAWVRLAATGRLDEVRGYRKADEDVYH